MYAISTRFSSIGRGPESLGVVKIEDKFSRSTFAMIQHILDNAPTSACCKNDAEQSATAVLYTKKWHLLVVHNNVVAVPESYVGTLMILYDTLQ